MISRLVSSLAGLALAGATAAASPQPRVVVELFTSQGCSSCPPADRVVAELAREAPDVIALSLPVDYWDYLGWKDTLAHSAFSARQRAYAGARGDRQVFTPQVVVNGVESCIGSDRGRIERSIARAGAGQAPLPVPVRITETGASIAVEVGAEGAKGGGEVWLLPVIRSREVTIGRGENRGRSVAYANVVRGLERVGAWPGGLARFEVPRAAARTGDADAYVVLVQEAARDKPGAILGAAKGPGF